MHLTSIILYYEEKNKKLISKFLGTPIDHSPHLNSTLLLILVVEYAFSISMIMQVIEFGDKLIILFVQYTDYYTDERGRRCFCCLVVNNWDKNNYNGLIRPL